MLKSLTNIDVDHRGRIWVCEVVNYRRHQNDRPEGDRILILEDTDQDGVVDKTKVFYQGRDIDSALGLCVLGNRVLVSAAPYVLEFTDENGDDVPDRKTQILTKTGQPQHDHSVHSFVFGPDGKLYFNFGNTGHQLCDSAGNPILDRWGRKINDSGNPYRQGMVFRCNEDLSDMEVLGHNFRNNYEVAVDSFGSLWQSDNDDDGNRATRINFVMEYGNYGYVDEVTGAGWQAERTNWEDEIPLRHWHLNDPGVVPTMLITGAGSPTGITVYEGSLLPERYRNQVIHTDAGPNVVRAYVTQKDGAGYSATIENIIVGEFDRWFRPADVCVAPDGSLFVSDWYDPGVGGHNMEDMERGRLFRVAPPQTPYRVPTYDFKTAAGATEALKSPNNSARYMAFKSLASMGKEAVPELQKLAKDANPRFRARALWLLARIGSPLQIVEQASMDSDPNVRMTGIRIARQYRVATRDYFPSFWPTPTQVFYASYVLPSAKTHRLKRRSIGPNWQTDSMERTAGIWRPLGLLLSIAGTSSSELGWPANRIWNPLHLAASYGVLGAVWLLACRLNFCNPPVLLIHKSRPSCERSISKTRNLAKMRSRRCFPH